ncbi:MAG: hypothetical protein U5O15_04935 [Candidatus Krumholzibacteriota bacterium]|nr:hypothetical protein [Candidatus Krumholzibacteriota bacterium]
MLSKKIFIIIILPVVAFAAFQLGCDKDSTYSQRTVLYVSNINEGAPFTSDVVNVNSGDSTVVEDFTTVTITNRPYSSIVDVDETSLGDFLVTGYRVEYETTDAGIPVESFSGNTSILVPANSTVEATILLVPLSDKNQLPLYGIRNTNTELISNARITFVGHEVQAEDRTMSFDAGLQVGFADYLDDSGS